MRLSGRFRSSLIIGLQGIRSRKVRTLLSMVSLFLGVLAVVVVQAGAAIAERAMLADLELSAGIDGTRQTYLPSRPGTADVVLKTLQGSPDGVMLLDTSAVVGEPGVRPLNAGGMSFDEVGRSGPVSTGAHGRCYASGMCTQDDSPAAGKPVGQAIEVSVTAMTGDIRTFRPFRPKSGQWLDFSTQPAMAPRIVLNEEAAKGFERFKVPGEMRVGGAATNLTPQIIGVVDDGRHDQPTVYVRLDELLTWLPAAGLADPQQGGNLQAMLKPDTATEQVLTRRLTGIGVPTHFETVQSMKDRASELTLIRLVFLAMAGLVLLIGVAGILNVGLATVGERVEEFALRRAVGTSRSLLAGIVLAETLLTGLLTAAAAIGAGAGALKVASILLGDSQPFLRDIQFPWQAGVAGIIAGLVAGVLGGFIPAIRAARIPIATVMRA